MISGERYGSPLNWMDLKRPVSAWALALIRRDPGPPRENSTVNSYTSPGSIQASLERTSQGVVLEKPHPGGRLGEERDVKVEVPMGRRVMYRSA